MNSEPAERKERRQHFRLQYPLAERPMSLIRGEAYPILDLSEGGIRIQVAQNTQFVEGETLALTMQLASKEFDVAGKVVRVKESSVGILLTEAIPLSTIRDVERTLREKYPYRS